MKGLFLLMFTLIMVSCGKDGISLSREPEIVYKTDPAQSEDYSYELKVGKCTTGRQTFKTFILTCQGLGDNTLNKDCAETKREELFTSSSCPGDFS